MWQEGNMYRQQFICSGDGVLSVFLRKPVLPQLIWLLTLPAADLVWSLPGQWHRSPRESPAEPRQRGKGALSWYAYREGRALALVWMTVT